MVKCPFSSMCIICTVVAVVSVSILIGLWTFQFVSSPKSKRSWESHSVSDSLVPDSYDVTLRPRLKADARGLHIFTGNSSVVFGCVKETDLILIHCNKLKLTAEPTLRALGDAPAPSITSHWMQQKTQYLVIHLNQNLKAGEPYELHTEFEGELADDLQKFYGSENDEGRVRTVVAANRTEVTNTARLFPRFDEPNMKSKIHLTLLHERGTVASSNSDATGDQHHRGGH